MFSTPTNALGLNPLKVDTLIDTPMVMVGDTLRGVIAIQGTTTDKTINHISLHLNTIAEDDTDNGDIRRVHTLGTVYLADNLTINAHERVHLPFELALSPETPVTNISCAKNQTKLWLETKVDVAATLDSKDNDEIYTLPTPVMANFLQAMEQAGFRLQKTDVEKGMVTTPYGTSSFGCYQEFEFSCFRLGLNSVEVTFLPKADYTYVVLEIDRAFRSDSYKVVGLNPHMTINDMVYLIQQTIGV